MNCTGCPSPGLCFALRPFKTSTTAQQGKEVTKALQGSPSNVCLAYFWALYEVECKCFRFRQQHGMSCVRVCRRNLGTEKGICLPTWRTLFIIHLITKSSRGKIKHDINIVYRQTVAAAQAAQLQNAPGRRPFLQRVAKFLQMTRSHVLDLATLALVNLLARWLMAKTNSLFVTERHLRLAKI